jgi:hypothetical protein
MTPEEHINNEILWAEALRDCLEDGEIEDALKSINAYLTLLRKQRRALGEGI